MVLGDARVYKIMDDRNRSNERHGTVPDYHTLSALLQLPRRFRQAPGEMRAEEAPLCIYSKLTIS